jgi:hypothetical protein
VPAVSADKSSDVALLLHAMEKGEGEPPVMVRSIAPSLPLAHVALVTTADNVGAVQDAAFNIALVVVTRY